MNIVGIRNNNPNIADRVTNVFDDFITVSFKDESKNWHYFIWPATTDPGKRGVERFQNKNF